MGNESPNREGPTRLVFWWMAMVALTFIALGPDSVWAHGGEKHGGAKAEAPAEPVEPVETPAHHEPEVHEQPATRPVEVVEAAPSNHPYPPAGVPRLLAWFGKFHPVATHFPIALLTMAALGEFLLLWRPRALYRDAVRFCVWAGAIGALVTAPLGWFFAGFRIVDEEWVMTAHRWAGTGVAIWALPLLVLSERAQRSGESRAAFRAALFFGAALVGAAGFLGGSLIYGLGHYAW